MTALDVAALICLAAPLISAILVAVVGQCIASPTTGNAKGGSPSFASQRPGGTLLTPYSSAIASCILMGIAMLASWYTGYKLLLSSEKEFYQTYWQWVSLENIEVSFGIYVDVLTVIMLMVVTTVSLCVHVYSLGYMERDPTLPRFMSYLSLFTFFMLLLASSANFIQLFVGWEGVGLCSYLLIGYWYHKKAAVKAANKAFIVNRIGDLGLVLGMAGCLFIFDSLDFRAIMASVPFVANTTTTFLLQPIDALTGITLLLFVGAMGKSAQFGLHVWLPDAMEGPTPVSALIHAATMVTAGVFLVARLSPLFEAAPYTLQFIAAMGILTAFFAATVGLVQNDIKRIIAYSTCSQLGFMFFAIGMSGYGIGIFHLVTHAFFKSLLFLGAGSVIHAMSDEQDIRFMGGLYKLIPRTYILMWIGTLSLVGMPFLSGYYSKEAILALALGYGGGLGTFIYYGALCCIALTTLYSVRLMMLTFHGPLKANEEVIAHVHESPPSMMIPLFALSLGAIFLGFLGHKYFVDNKGEFWGDALLWLNQIAIIHKAHTSPSIWLHLPVVVMLTAGLGSWLLYGPFIAWSTRLRVRFNDLHQFLYAKWYVDEFYTNVLVQPYKIAGYILWRKVDRGLIDGCIIHGGGLVIYGLSILAGKLQTGRIYHYVLAILVGIATLLTYYTLTQITIDWL